MKIILETKNYEIVSAHNGTEGMLKADKEKPDLIILDVMMDEMSEGFQVSSQLKDNPKFSHIPILMVTAISSKTGIKFSPQTNGEFLPIEDFMEKPIDPAVLLEKVEKLIKREKP
jgi:CheY-like chemotaxis protein